MLFFWTRVLPAVEFLLGAVGGVHDEPRELFVVHHVQELGSRPLTLPAFSEAT